MVGNILKYILYNLSVNFTVDFIGKQQIVEILFCRYNINDIIRVAYYLWRII